MEPARRDEIIKLNLERASAIQGDLRSLGHGAALLHYLVLKDTLKIVVTTPNIQRVFSVKVSRGELSNAIDQFRKDIGTQREVRPQAKKLYDWLIAPVSAELRDAKAQMLMVALTDVLRYLPMAALHDGDQWLAQRYRLAMYTEASGHGLMRKPAPQWSAQAFGLSRAVPGFSALPGVRTELAAIIGPQGLPGHSALDDQFTEQALRDSVTAQPPVLHVASHFVFSPNPSGSYLMLGDGQRLTLGALGRMQFVDLDLLTLSACETALGGGRDVNGKEVEGLGAIARIRGADAVIATLWKVADGSTAQFMQHFYISRQAGPGVTKAEALQRAQLALINGDFAPAAGATVTPAIAEQRAQPSRMNTSTTALQPSATNPYAHPYYWAPFVLMGNWL